jgi:hypothetical protein
MYLVYNFSKVKINKHNIIHLHVLGIADNLVNVLPLYGDKNIEMNDGR